VPTRFLTNFISNSEEETISLGKHIAAFLCTGSVVALRGELGSGKTHLVKGIASGLGIKETVTSPTYTIISEYKSENNLTLFHIDAYRLNSEEDFEQIGGSEIINSSGISIIEWSERISKSLPQDAITITLNITGAASRLIQIDSIQKDFKEML